MGSSIEETFQSLSSEQSLPLDHILILVGSCVAGHVVFCSVICSLSSIGYSAAKFDIFLPFPPSNKKRLLIREGHLLLLPQLLKSPRSVWKSHWFKLHMRNVGHTRDNVCNNIIMAVKCVEEGKKS